MEKAIFLDIDNTLLYQVPWAESSQLAALVKGASKNALAKKSLEDVKKLLKEPDSCLMLGSTVMVITPRPGAHVFVEELKKYTKNLYIMTKGTVNHQSKVLKEAGFEGFSGIFGRDSKLHPNMSISILVDNNSPRDMTTVWKMSLLGMLTSERPGTLEYSNIIKAKYVQVSSFQNKLEDEPLDSYLDEVISKFDNLSSNVVAQWLGKLKKNT
jgi:hypothetical protein